MNTKFSLANVFLTCTNHVGMQWEVRSGRTVVGTYTVWMDKRGQHASQSMPLNVAECMKADAFYANNWKRYKFN